MDWVTEESPKPITASFGKGRYAVNAIAAWCGADIVASFTGGECAHIGAASLAVYEPVRDSATVSTMTVFTHRDDYLASRGAKLLAATFRCTACVTVGIHVDDANANDVRILCDSFDACAELLKEHLKERISVR